MLQTSGRSSRPPTPRRRRLLWVAVALAATVAIVPLIAQKAEKSAPPASGVTPAKAAAPPAAGLRVFKDPLTGEFRDPDPSDIQALAGAPVVSSTAPKTALQQPREATAVEFPLPGGGFASRADESTMAFAVAKIGPDGKVTFECVTGEQQARKALTKPSAPAVKRPAPTQVLEVK